MEHRGVGCEHLLCGDVPLYSKPESWAERGPGSAGLPFALTELNLRDLELFPDHSARGEVPGNRVGWWLGNALVLGTWPLKAQVGKQMSRCSSRSLRQVLARGGSACVSGRARILVVKGKRGDLVEPAADLVPGFTSRWVRGARVQGRPYGRGLELRGVSSELRPLGTVMAATGGAAGAGHLLPASASVSSTSNGLARPPSWDLQGWPGCTRGARPVLCRRGSHVARVCCAPALQGRPTCPGGGPRCFPFPGSWPRAPPQCSAHRPEAVRRGSSRGLAAGALTTAEFYHFVTSCPERITDAPGRGGNQTRDFLRGTCGWDQTAPLSCPCAAPWAILRCWRHSQSPGASVPGRDSRSGPPHGPCDGECTGDHRSRNGSSGLKPVVFIQGVPASRPQGSEILTRMISSQGVCGPWSRLSWF